MSLSAYCMNKVDLSKFENWTSMFIIFSYHVFTDFRQKIFHRLLLSQTKENAYVKFIDTSLSITTIIEKTAVVWQDEK